MGLWVEKKSKIKIKNYFNKKQKNNKVKKDKMRSFVSVFMYFSFMVCLKSRERKTKGVFRFE